MTDRNTPRRSSRRPQSRRGAPTLRSLQEKVTKITKALRSERLQIVNYNSQATSSVGAVNYLSNIGQGDGANQRHGNDVYVTGIEGLWSVVGADATNVVRMMIIQDANSGGAVPLVGDIFETASNPHSAINNLSQSRFKVLWDKFLGLSYGTGEGVRTGSIDLRFSPPIHVSYYTTGATTAGAAVNSLWLVTISDSGAATHPTTNVYTSTMYTDEASV